METIVAALVGLCGVCFTLYWNARSARIERQNQRSASRRALIEGLLGELETNRALLKPYVQAFDLLTNKRGAGFRIKEIKIGSFIVTEIFSTSISNLGLLDNISIRHITFCYSTLKMFDAFLRNYQSSLHKDAPITRAGYPGIVVRIDPENVNRIRHQIEECMTAIDQAICALENKNAVERPTASMDILRRITAAVPRVKAAPVRPAL